MGAPAGAAKVIVIGLDSADRRLVEKWCDSGDLPVLQSMRKRGAYGHLTGFPALGDDATWASFYTSVSPGRHGRYFWQYLDQGTYDGRLCRHYQLPVEPFWAVLSQSGLRVAVLDVPKSPLTPGLNGIQIADWQVHGRDYPETCSWPPELAKALLSRFGDDQTDRAGTDWLCLLHSLPEEKLALFRSYLLDGLKKKTQFASELLAQDNWDLFLVVFKEAHCVGHQCWHMTESSGQVDNTRLTDDPVKEIYRALDNAIGEIVGHAGPETAVIIFSDIGMDSNQTAEHFLDQILQRLDSRLATPLQRARLAARRMKRGIRSFGRRRTAEESHPRADRLAYQLEHNEISGAIRINLAGREPAGIVLPGAEYEKLRKSLTKELLALRDPSTGEQLVASVISASDVYPGENQHRLPDLFAVWAREGPITGAMSPSLGTLTAAAPGYRTGNHVLGGFYVGIGPTVSPGNRHGPASIMDLAPTVARLLNARLPGREGRPVPELCGD
jgi:predicted AlkP superfamily phosphohydrolase/phosphomutase